MSIKWGEAEFESRLSPFGWIIGGIGALTVAGLALFFWPTKHPQNQTLRAATNDIPSTVVKKEQSASRAATNVIGNGATNLFIAPPSLEKKPSVADTAEQAALGYLQNPTRLEILRLRSEARSFASEIGSSVKIPEGSAIECSVSSGGEMEENPGLAAQYPGYAFGAIRMGVRFEDLDPTRYFSYIIVGENSSGQRLYWNLRDYSELIPLSPAGNDEDTKRFLAQYAIKEMQRLRNRIGVEIAGKGTLRIKLRCKGAVQADLSGNTAIPEV